MLASPGIYWPRRAYEASDCAGGPDLTAARSKLGEEADYLEAIRLIERQAGIEIRG
jgi:hypothetical protein